MANEIRVMFEGRLTADPELVVIGEKTVASVRVAHSARKRQGDKWNDTAAMFFEMLVWPRWDGDSWPENVVASLSKGDQVTVVGGLWAEDWKARDGREGRSFRIQVESLSPSLQGATAVLERNPRRDGAGQSGWAPQSSAEAPF